MSYKENLVHWVAMFLGGKQPADVRASACFKAAAVVHPVWGDITLFLYFPRVPMGVTVSQFGLA